MKDKILYLVLGILIGAVITSGVFLIFSKNSKPEMPENFQGGQMIERGENKDFDPTNTVKPQDESIESNIVENNV